MYEDDQQHKKEEPESYMFAHIVKIDKTSFPRSFVLLQQEAILANSSLLSGFEYLIKGGFDSVHKGAYYASFFDLTIGFERIMKLVVIANFMVENDCELPTEKELKHYGHDLRSLYENTVKVANEYGLKINPKDEIDTRLISFLNDFADAKLGRYYNISDISGDTEKDPIKQWSEVLDQIFCEDLSEQIHSNIENRTFNNLSSALQVDDIVHNTGYVEGVYKHHKTLALNRYALLRLIDLLKPITRTLSQISMQSHKIETTENRSNLPSIPYFNEIFLFAYSDRQTIMRRKRWTDLIFR